MENCKNIVNIWIGLSICAYAGKTNCNDCRAFYNFTTNKIKISNSGRL
jgi:hypothetical protein